MKYRQAALSDGLLLIAHVSSARVRYSLSIRTDGSSWQVLHMAHWLVLLFALIGSLGKSESVTSAVKETRASKVSSMPITSGKSSLMAVLFQLVFASQILFVVILSATKLSTTFLIREIFTKDATRWWFRVIVLTALAQAFVGSLLLSIECSPSHKLDGQGNEHCPGRVRPCRFPT